MSTWLNGLGPDRPRKRALPAAAPLEAINREIVRSATRERESKLRQFATVAIDSFLALFQDYGFSTRYSHRRYRPAISTRAAPAIIAEVRSFYRQRPRPWLSPNARARLMRVARRDRARLIERRAA